MTNATAFTSRTHPLWVDFVEVPASGRLGMTFAPGKVQPRAAFGSWARDLALDLERLRDVYGAHVLVSIIEEHELRELRIEQLGPAAEALGLRWIHVPVVDGQIPTDEAAWLEALRAVRACLHAAQTVIVHCRGGLGRTGTFAASLLTTYGIDPEDAIRSVRESRPGAIETDDQTAYVTYARDAWCRREAARG